MAAGGIASGIAGVAGAIEAIRGSHTYRCGCRASELQGCDAALETEPAQRAKAQVVTRAREAVNQTKSMGRDVRQGLNRV